LIGGTNYSTTVSKDLPIWLALNQKSYYFPAKVVARAIEQLSSLEDLWQSNDTILESVGFDKKSIKELAKIRSDSTIQECERLINVLTIRSVKVIRFIDEEYPKQLKDTKISDPPLLIFHKGSEINFNKCAAIVGTRNPTFYGRSMARKIAKTLADEEFIIVSGLARGIDIESHCGALESKHGKTIAVLAWFDPIYPDEHSELVKDIERRGARISENYQKAFGSMTPNKFVERNRITSALSDFIIIVETGEDGGTVRQAELAYKQNKPVFVLSPKENERASRGFTLIMEKYNGISFRDTDDLLDRINENKLSPEKRLSQFNLDPQMKLE